MPLRIEAGVEPIPGYKLIERLGSGGFGEVWKAEAPGGLFKAMKFVFGDLQGAGEDSSRAEQELKALSRVKTVHHPYILSLERYDIIDGQLVIVMELADRTVWDRFRECRQQGLPGIPREELLGYLQEAAEALDLMNGQFQLQHLDIKPQNLFLVFNHVKVADFGLVKDLGNMAAATITGGVTPVYAAPETFDGWLSRFSDQYSLAIVYQELLTGVRPFAGSTMRQLVLQHLQNPPDVSALPAADRPAVIRALAKNPDDRFPTCLELLQTLRSGGQRTAPSPSAAPEETESRPTPPTSFPKLPESPTQFAETWKARKGAVPIAPVSETTTPRNLPGSAAHSAPPADLLSALTRKTPAGTLPRRIDVSSSQLPARPTGVFQRPVSPGLAPVSTPAPPLDDEAPRGVQQPALLLGLGQLGLETLQQMRRILAEEFGLPEAVPYLRMLGLDTDPEALKNVTTGDSRSALRNSEMMLTRLQRANHYLNKLRGDNKLPTDSWLNPRLLYRIPRDQGKAPVRALARFAFVNYVPYITRRLQEDIQGCATDDTLPENSTFADLGIRSRSPRVYVIANLAGATGSGMFLDLAYLVRAHLRQMRLSKAEVVGLFFLPAADAAPGAGSNAKSHRAAALANTYAALSELDYFIRNNGMKAQYASLESKDVLKLDETGPPFDRCFFMSLGEPPAASEERCVPEAVHQAAQFLYRDLITPLGPALDKARQKYLTRSTLQYPGGPLLEAFGLHRLSWPRRALQQRMAERFCVRLVDRWKSKDATALAAPISEWVHQQWEALEMRPENLIARHQEQIERALRTTPEKIFQEIVQPLNLTLPAKGESTTIHLSPAVAAMDRLEKMLGVPELARESSQRNAEPASLERTLLEISAVVTDQCDHKLAQLVVGLIEAPQYRLAGAEEALRRLNVIAEQALKVQETLARELSERAAALYRRIHEYFERFEKIQEKSTSGSSSLWFSRKSNPGTNYVNELLDLLRVYPKAQYQALLLGCINRLYISIRGHVSDQLREVGFCRQRLDELAGLLKQKKTPARRGAYEKFLLPPGNDRLEDVLEALEGMLTEEDFLALDERAQAHIQKQYKALLNVCLGPASVVRALAPTLMQEAETYLDQRFPPPSVADLMLSQGAAHDTIEAVLENALREVYDEAAPDLARLQGDKEIALAVVPDDASGQALVAAAARALPGTGVVPSDRREEILLYREQLLNGLNDLEQMGPAAQEVYRQKQTQDPSSLHAREDITDWQGRAVPAGSDRS